MATVRTAPSFPEVIGPVVLVATVSPQTNSLAQWNLVYSIYVISNLLP